MKAAFTITTGTTVLGHFGSESAALAWADKNKGRGWEDWSIWNSSGELLAVVKDGDLVRMDSPPFTPAA
jgi:hypothetical protein